MKNYFSKHIQDVISLRPVVAMRCIDSSGKTLDRPIVLVYSSSGHVIDIMSVSWTKHMASSNPYYFKGLSTELRFFF